MSLASSSESYRRLRRAPQDAREEILRAARAIVLEEGYAALTVERVMQQTGMTRSSFYHYFRNLEDVTAGVFEPVETGMIAAVEPWLTPEATTLPAATIERSLERVVAIVARHRGLFAAVDGVVARHRETWEQWRVRVFDLFVDKTADFVRSLHAGGVSDAGDADEIARLLILLNNAALLDWARRPDAEPPEALARSLSRIWVRTLLVPATGD